MISNMMLTKSYSDIAKALDLTKDDIGAVVLELTLGSGLVPYELKLKERWEKKNKQRAVKKYRPGAKEVVKVKPAAAAAKKKAEDKAFAESLKKQKLQAAKQQQQSIQASQAAKRRPSQYKTIAVDYTRQQTLRIDRKTTIYVKPGEDPEVVKATFLKNYKHLILKPDQQS